MRDILSWGGLLAVPPGIMPATGEKKGVALCAWSADSSAPPKSKLKWPQELKAHPFIGEPRECLPALNEVVCIVKADIARLPVAAIVNGAAASLVGGGGVDGAIRAVAGPGLTQELRGQRCAVGAVVTSGGHKLPCRHVLHTVAPKGGQAGADGLLRSCYASCLSCVDELHLESLAFCCLGTGIFKFPNVRAAHVALSSAREWLEQRLADGKPLVRLVFCIFDDVDVDAYRRLAPHYFPKTANADAPSAGAPGAAAAPAAAAPAAAAPAAAAPGAASAPAAAAAHDALAPPHAAAAKPVAARLHDAEQGASLKRRQRMPARAVLGALAALRLLRGSVGARRRQVAPERVRRRVT